MKAQCVVPEDIHTPPFSVWILAPNPPPLPTHTHQYGFTLSHENVCLCDLPTLQFHCAYNYEVVMDILWNHTCWTWWELYILHKESIQQCTRITVLVVFSLVVCSWEEWCYLLSIISSLKSTDEKIWKLV